MPKLEACLTAINAWMSANMLILNQEETELFMLRLNHQLKVSDKPSLKLEKNFPCSTFHEELEWTF